MTADVTSIYTKKSLSIPVALSLFFFWPKKKKKKLHLSDISICFFPKLNVAIH